MPAETIVVGQLQTNCYLVWDKKTKKTLIIDPGDDAELIINRIRDLNLKPLLLLATHGHFDHLLAITELRLSLKISFLMHPKDLFLLNRASKTALHFTSIPADLILPPDRFLKDKQVIIFGESELSVIHTPGHTPGGVSFRSSGMIFCGDTLFAQGIGRTDFKYASAPQLQNSISQILEFPPKTRIYPGHGPSLLISNISGKIA